MYDKQITLLGEGAEDNATLWTSLISTLPPHAPVQDRRTDPDADTVSSLSSSSSSPPASHATAGRWPLQTPPSLWILCLSHSRHCGCLLNAITISHLVGGLAPILFLLHGDGSVTLTCWPATVAHSCHCLLLICMQYYIFLSFYDINHFDVLSIHRSHFHTYPVLLVPASISLHAFLGHC